MKSVIVMGASTGGVSALKRVISALPAQLEGAVLVVLHRADSHPDLLPEILQKESALPVTTALHAERLEAGHVYVAPPDNHLLVRTGHVEVVRGPRENGSRPALNPLFRTAANAYGKRVIGVVLTGQLDCGTAGFLAIKARGGVTIAQDPNTAACRDMPESAIRSGSVDEVVPLDSIARRLVELTSERDAAPLASVATESRTMPQSFITCPSCNGSLTEGGTATSPEFECHVGHRFSLPSLYAEQADEVESALWAAARALEEGAAVARRLSEASSDSVRPRFAERARAMDAHARTIIEIILGATSSSRADVFREQPADESTRP